jgi:hypothetical protein
MPGAISAADKAQLAYIIFLTPIPHVPRGVKWGLRRKRHQSFLIITMNTCELVDGPDALLLKFANRGAVQIQDSLIE